MNENTNLNVNRRRFLRTTMATAGLGTTIVGTTSAKEPVDFGNVHFVEMGIEHDADIPEGDGYVIPITEEDEALGYSIDTEERSLKLNRFAPPNARANFRQESKVVKTESYRPFPTTDQKKRIVRSLYTKLTSDYRGTRSLSLAEPYRRPPVEISSQDAEISASVGGKHQIIGPGQERTIHLPERTVEIIAERQVDEGLSDIPPGRRAKTVWEEFSKTITVEPHVKVRNRGILSVSGSGN